MYDHLRAFKSAPVPFWQKLALAAAYGGAVAFAAVALLYWLSVPAYAGQDAQFKADALDFVMGDRPAEKPCCVPARKVYQTAEVNQAYDAHGGPALVEITIIVPAPVVVTKIRPEGRTAYRQYQHDKHDR